MATFEGSLDGSGQRLAIVVSRFNEIVTEPLLRRAIATAHDHGIGEEALDVVRVPGAFELPQAARRLASQGGYDAIVCLGRWCAARRRISTTSAARPREASR